MSKLGFHVSNGKHDNGAGYGLGQLLREAAAAGNPVSVLYALNQNLYSDVSNYSPSTVLVYRTQTGLRGKELGDAPGDMYQGDPMATARSWMTELMPVWALNPATYHSPTNEQDPSTLEHFHWLDAFTQECIRVAVDHGYRLALHGFAAGNPKDLLHPTTGEVLHTAAECWQALLPSLKLGKQSGCILLLHEYGQHYGSLKSSVPHLALRFVGAYRQLPLEAQLPLVLSEVSGGAGFDGHNFAGWFNDLQWYEQQTWAYPYVIGCCAYQLGGDENFAHFLKPMGQYITNTPTVTPTPPPPAASGESYKVLLDLSVRVSPEHSEVTIAVIPAGTIVSILEHRSGGGDYEWGKLQQGGWITLQRLPATFAEKLPE